MVKLSVQDLHLDLKMSDKGKYFDLTNIGGTNQLSQYPVRAMYSFDGPEMIYQLPKLEGEYSIYIDPNGRVPDVEVDLFILMDPTDANSAIRWMNGTGVIQRISFSPDQDYFIAVDGFANQSASLRLAMVPAPAPPSFCNTASDPIDLNAFLTMGTKAPSDIWSRISGTGGSFDAINGIFTPTPGGTTTSVFRLERCSMFPITTEDITIVFDGSACPSIPTMGEWALIILSLLMLSFAVIAVKQAPLKA